jgi:hypothetical protein
LEIDLNDVFISTRNLTDSQTLAARFVLAKRS